MKKMARCVIAASMLVIIGIYSPTVLANEKLTCEITDAPNVDLTAIVQSLERKIDDLKTLEVALKQARVELKQAANKEEAGIALQALAAVVKATSAITLTVTAAVASTPGISVAASAKIFALSIANTTTNLIIDAINNSGKTQDQVLKDTMRSYGSSQADLLTGQLLKTFDKPAIESAWSGVSVIYTVVNESLNLISVAEEKPLLRTQINGLTRQLKQLQSKIRLLKSKLLLAKKQVSLRDRKIDADFMGIWLGYVRKNPNSCSDTPTGGSSTDNGGDETNQSCANAMAQEGALHIAVNEKNSACIDAAAKTRDAEKSNCDSQYRDNYGYWTEGHDQCLKDADYKYYNARQACDAESFSEHKAITDNTNRICSS